jgi:hypothetical protein
MKEILNLKVAYAIKDTMEVLKSRGIDFELVSGKEMEAEIDSGADVENDNEPSCIKLKGRLQNVYVAEFGYGHIAVDAKGLNDDTEYFNKFINIDWCTDSGTVMVDHLQKYFL